VNINLLEYYDCRLREYMGIWVDRMNITERQTDIGIHKLTLYTMKTLNFLF